MSFSTGHWKTLWAVLGGVVRQAYCLVRKQHRRRVAPGSWPTPLRGHVLVAVGGHLFHRWHVVLLPGGVHGRPEREVSKWEQHWATEFGELRENVCQKWLIKATVWKFGNWRRCWWNYVVAQNFNRGDQTVGCAPSLCPSGPIWWLETRSSVLWLRIPSA